MESKFSKIDHGVKNYGQNTSILAKNFKLATKCLEKSNFDDP